MRIGIDISSIPYGTGVSVYTKELVRALTRLDTQNEYILFGGSLRRREEIYRFVDSLDRRVKSVIASFPPFAADLVWNRMHVWPVERFIGKLDIFHSSDWAQPPTKAKTVTTIHDLAPFIYPRETHPKIRAVHKRRLGWIKKEVDAVIVPSESSKKEAVKLGVNEAKIHVIPEALRPNFSTSEKRPNVRGKYLLTVGTAGRKNIDRTAEAFRKVKQKLKIEKLVVIGQVPANLDLDGPRSSDVVFTGHVSDLELGRYYSHAEALVYTSLHEGFGLPILEGFASGIPVVTSNVSSMPEVAGDAAILVDPRNVRDISKGIEKALKNKKDLAKKGKVRLKSFSWQRATEETLKVYTSLCS